LLDSSSTDVDARDAELLLAFRGAAAPAFPNIARGLCESIREHLAAHEADLDEAQLRGLASRLESWLWGICSRFEDPGTHQRLTQAMQALLDCGVSQHQLLVTMACVRLALLRAADGTLGERATPTREALNRTLDMDLSTLLDSYRVLEARACASEKLSAIANLVARLAHEIRNPLNGAQLHLVILERALKAKASEQEALQAIQMIRSELRRVAAMLTEFLELSRPQPLELDSVSVRGVFKGN
jgi:signal transduction histidine kinase